MTKTTFSTWMATGMLAANLLLPVPPTLAQTTTPTPETRTVDRRADRDTTGVWGLLGVAGFLGLAGLGRRREDVRAATNPRARSRA